MPRGSREGIVHAAKFRWAPWRERFESYIDRTPGFGPWGDCHRWTGPASGYPGNQYGRIMINKRYQRAHRVAWEIAHGRRFPRGKFALHSCDVGLCVNPYHISPGTQADNMRQAAERGRLDHPRQGPTNPARGVAHPNARFTNRDIAQIRLMHTRGHTIASLAHQYGAGWSTIDQIVKRKTWKHVP